MYSKATALASFPDSMVRYRTDRSRPKSYSSVVGNGGRTIYMLWTVAVIMLVLWLLGLITSYTMGGFIHILLVIAIVVIAVNLIQGRRI